jgi:hypothetical protein
MLTFGKKPEMTATEFKTALHEAGFGELPTSATINR